ncbi:hypothetical protein [Lapillicoccus sp.]|uniref:hypothetical protein n=1 Tax=Lapillicoccus sp. TaxID=1909287 RepID=UPI0025D148D4|nr:hypothetical protein [Lapillicoccus sp.]
MRFVSAAGTRLRVVEGGQHFLSASKPDDVNAAAVEFANRWTSRRWCVVGGVSRIM